MRTGSYAYHVARRDALAFGGELDVSRWDRFSAESEDACELYDALQLYDEHTARDYAVMKAMAYRQVDWHEFADAESGI